MTILESVDRAAVARVLVALVVIAGRAALDRVLPRGRFAGRRPIDDGVPVSPPGRR